MELNYTSVLGSFVWELIGLGHHKRCFDAILPPPSFPPPKGQSHSFLITRTRRLADPLLETMTRYTIEQGKIEIAYGTDHATGYFLAVVDQRLMWKENASETVNGTVEKIDAGGDGSYFNLHTGAGGFGFRVSKEVIAEFMQRYGVPEDKLKLVRAGKNM